jgi:hypothetical protein
VRRTPEPIPAGTSQAAAGIALASANARDKNFDESFQEFADRIGANTLQELLEASAAYTTLVEGLPRFSRQHLMANLSKFGQQEAFSKEAGLRSFGKLLREGRILRVQEGKFAISKSARHAFERRVAK